MSKKHLLSFFILLNSQSILSGIRAGVNLIVKGKVMKLVVIHTLLDSDTLIMNRLYEIRFLNDTVLFSLWNHPGAE